MLARNWDTLKTLSAGDRRDVAWLMDDNSEWLPDSLRWRTARKGIFGWFYTTPAHFFEVNEPAFRLRANPMLQFELDRQQNDEELVFYNRRGLEVRGDIDRKVFFYSNLLENQVRLPDYAELRQEQYNAVPGAGFVKPYNSGVFNITNGYDFLLAQAYVGFRITPHVGLHLGHGSHFIGNGYRSLFLSDVGNNAFFLRLDTRIWRFHYQNLFLELSPFAPNNQGSSVNLPKKYAAIHYLNYNITPRMSVGLFEATVFNRSRQFEFQYLNPVILYRTVESMIGSADNVLLGLDGRWDVARRVRLYGQLLVDEFLLSQIISPEQKGWWGNKYGIQAGVKYFKAFGVDRLDVQAEFNAVRPFTYSHLDSLNSWTSYSQPLAHPLGANFNEIIGRATWRPLPKLTLQGRIIAAKTGDNRPGENWGADPLWSYEKRVKQFGNTIAQGEKADILLLGLDASWELWHNIYVDVKFQHRQKDSQNDALDLTTRLFGAGIRMNFWPTNNLDF